MRGELYSSVVIIIRHGKEICIYYKCPNDFSIENIDDIDIFLPKPMSSEEKE